MGIRRLVHRGMVYGVATLGLFSLIAVGLAAAVPFTGNADGTYPPLALAGFLVGGIILFYPMRRATRWLVDQLIYGEVVDPQTFLGVLEENLVGSGDITEVTTGITGRFAQALRLESALMFLGPDPAHSQLVAAMGDRARSVDDDHLPHLEPYIETAKPGLTELAWESDSFLLATLQLSGRYLGHILLGPKRAGEVIIEEEKRLVASIAPILALAIDKGQLSEDLRVLNRQLTKTQEAERARIAADLHDGPLQKAMILTGARIGNKQVRESVSREMIFELREIMSRLRPAILDDLGIVSALEWLADGVSRREGLETNLSLHNVGEDDRFEPDIELALFRVTQEATNNVVKYAKGSSIDVSLSRRNNHLELRVSDDGVGFRTSARVDGGSGISGMRERVVQLDGSFKVTSKPSEGTTVVARIPLTAGRR